MKTIILILALVLINFTIYSQFQQSWVSSYTGNEADTPGKNIGTDQYGNVYVTGSSINSGTDSDILTVKYNSAGVQQWTATYNHSLDFGIAIAVDYYTGDVYVLGQIIYGPKIFVTIKYNTSGQQQWVNFAGAQLGYPAAIVLDQYSNVYITGGDQMLNLNDYFLTVKYNSNGVQQWYSRYTEDDHSFDFSYDIAVDDLGNVYVTGERNLNYATVKYNSNGTQVWASSYNGSDDGIDRAISISIDNSTYDVYVTGKSLKVYLKGEPSIYNYDFATIKYDVNGNQVWSRLFGGSGNSHDEGIKVIVHRDRTPPQFANIYVTGISSGSNITTIAYNSITSNTLWSSTYNDATPRSMDVDNNGNVYISGYTESPGSSDFLTLQYAGNGQLLWSATYNGSGNGNDETKAINVDPSGNNIYVSGFSTGISTGIDYTLIKYVKSSDDGDDFTRSTIGNYPNPFNPITQITFKLPHEDFITLKIYNLIGEEIETLINNEYKNKGTHIIEFNAQNLPSGVYFYKLISTNHTQTQKMLLIK